MKRLPILVVGVMCGIGMGVEAAQVSSLCGSGWRFTRDRTANCQMKPVANAFDDSSWDVVEVPHDWAISGPFKPEDDGNTGKLPWRGVGWYRRGFSVSDATMKNIKAGGDVWLEFDGVMARPQVFVNGKYAGGWNYGYMSFRVDVSALLKSGDNMLAVRADTRDHHSRWYPGAGIYRAVRLVEAPAVHTVPSSAVVTTPAIAHDSAVARVAFAITNGLGKSSCAQVAVRLYDARGTQVVERVTEKCVVSKSCEAFVFNFEVPHPTFWDVEAPYLYDAVITVGKDENVDTHKIRFGIREAVFTADDGFHLNGRRVQIQGVDLHADMGPLGMAFNRSVMKRQLQLMKDMGANALRTSHNACDPQVLELCDEMGIVVWNECFDKWDGTSGRRGNEKLEDYVVENLKLFAQRDRNHPSVVVWSIGNEICPNGWDWSGKNPNAKDGMSAERFRIFRAAIREFDTTRPVGIGCCHTQAVGTGMFKELDITGWNYNAQYRAVKAKHPEMPVLYSESASALSSYGAFEQPPASSKIDYDVAKREVGAYEHNAAPWSDIADVEFAYMEQDRYCGGEFVWTGIDYLGEPTPYVYGSVFPMMASLKRSELARSSYFGIADLMGIPKERYWIYRAHWNHQSPTLHISPNWNWAGREGKKVPVYVYTDADEAELFLNGKSLGRRKKGVSQKLPNLAAGKAVTASSEEVNETKNNRAILAMDGVTDSRWCAANDQKGAWWQVDLGNVTAFKMIRFGG